MNKNTVIGELIISDAPIRHIAILAILVRLKTHCTSRYLGVRPRGKPASSIIFKNSPLVKKFTAKSQWLIMKATNSHKQKVKPNISYLKKKVKLNIVRMAGVATRDIWTYRLRYRYSSENNNPTDIFYL